MKIKKFFLLSGFAVALTASFAFTSKKALSNQFAWYYSGLPGGETCTTGYTDNVPDYLSCSPGWIGPACTIFDNYTFTDKQAYQMSPDPSTCLYPLYMPPF